MPRVPKWLGDVIESTFSGSYTSVVVSKTEYVHEQLKLIRFEGEFSTVKKEFIAGNVVEFRVNDTDYRHYTPAAFSVHKGYCDVLFYLHGKGPGSQWAEDLKVGNDLKMIGPGSKMSYNKAFQYHVVFGDETSLGLFQCMEEEASRNGHQLLCLSELDPGHKDWLADTGILSGIYIEKNERHQLHHAGAFLQKWFQKEGTTIDHACFYLTGNARSIQSFRKVILAMGGANKHIQTYPYWVEGKKGL